MTNNIIWISTRESDLIGAEDVFDGSITIFGSGKGKNISMEKYLNKRHNYCEDFDEYEKFMQFEMEKLIEKNPETRFVQYSPIDCYYLPKKIQSYFIYQNSYDIILLLENKIYTQIWLQNCVDVLPMVSLLGNEFSYTYLSKIMQGGSEFIVQGKNSWGGSGTFYLSKKNEKEIRNKLSDYEVYMITPYCKDSISVNIHAVIYEEYIQYFPASIQIIRRANTMEYRGADFTSYSMLSTEQKSSIDKTAQLVCKQLQKIGYRGVCGVDILLWNGVAYFMEVNPRFQSSTALLNISLKKQGFPTVQEYHIESFRRKKPQCSCSLQFAEGSFYTFQYYKEYHDYLKWYYEHAKHLNGKGLEYIDDALNWNCTLDEGTYLFKLIFSRNITFTDRYLKKIRIHVNINENWNNSDKFDINNIKSLLLLKIMLLCRGVFISKAATTYFTLNGDVDYEEFSAITLQLKDDVWVTVPCGNILYDLSPFSIDYDFDNSQLILCYFGKLLLKTDVQKKDIYYDCETTNGHYMSEIMYIGLDRLRIFFRNGCYFRENGMACKFCDLIGTKNNFTMEEIQEAFDKYKAYPQIKHFLIGGGSDAPDSNYKKIIQLSNYIKQATDKPIYVMCLPCNDINILLQMKKAGVTEIAFNIEIFNRDYAKLIMPGKGSIPLQYYIEALEKAVSIWGNTGKVRSIILIGIDEEDVLLSGIEQLCKIGVTPILSYLYALPETPMERYIGPSELDVQSLYYKIIKICQDYDITLGPDCSLCQCNIIHIS